MDKLTYNNKFKDRTPEETIKIISHYFESIGCKLELSLNRETVINTWCCHLSLYFEDRLLTASNGKGTTEIFSKASAYAELYERFCNKMFCFCNAPLINRVMDFSKREYGYYFDSKERLINFEDAFLASKVGRIFYEGLEQNGIVRNYFNTIYQNRFVGIPFYKSHSDEIKYLDPRIITFLSGSSGMSAGNTFYEAYIQGVSEIYEHYVASQYYIDKHNVYYAINLKSITNPKLQELISKIQKSNTLYLIDFSYNYNVPVLCGVIVNKKTHTVSVDLGAAPVFDIACERVLTELYQGREKGFNRYKPFGQFPSVNYNLELKDMLWPRTEVDSPVFPEYIMQRIRIISNHSNIFLIGNYSNEELYNYIETINKSNNFEIYWHNFSAIKEMYALKLFNINAHVTSGIDFKNFSNYINTEHFKWCKKYFLIIEKYLQTSVIDIDDFFEFNNVLLNTSPIEGQHMLYLMFDTYLKWANSGAFAANDIARLTNILLTDRNVLCNFDTDVIAEFIDNPVIYKQLNKYATIIRFLSREEYSIDEVKFILKFLEIEYSSADIANLNNHQYLIENIIFADLKQYHTGEYDNLLKLLASYNRALFSEE